VWRRHAADTAILVAAFALSPTILSVGAYFCGWHALRHVARPAALDPGWRRSGRVRPVARRLAVAAAAPTAIALAGLVALAILAPSRTGDPLGLLGSYLVGLALLTLPHTVVVTWLDVRQGIWGIRPPRGGAR
jgi:beta-carotene 15,15'-dioxygenase